MNVNLPPTIIPSHGDESSASTVITIGARARIRTGDLPLRRRLLYPSELHAHSPGLISLAETVGGLHWNV